MNCKKFVHVPHVILYIPCNSSTKSLKWDTALQLPKGLSSSTWTPTPFPNVAISFPFLYVPVYVPIRSRRASGTETVPRCYQLGTDLPPTPYPSTPISLPRRDPIGNNLISFWCQLRTHFVPNWYPFDSNSDTHCTQMVATVGRRRGRVQVTPPFMTAFVKIVQTLATHQSSCAA